MPWQKFKFLWENNVSRIGEFDAIVKLGEAARLDILFRINDLKGVEIVLFLKGLLSKKGNCHLVSQVLNHCNINGVPRLIVEKIWENGDEFAINKLMEGMTPHRIRHNNYLNLRLAIQGDNYWAVEKLTEQMNNKQEAWQAVQKHRIDKMTAEMFEFVVQQLLEVRDD
jgi:hypothetical protein